MGDFIPEDDEPTETELAYGAGVSASWKAIPIAHSTAQAAAAQSHVHLPTADDTPWDAGVPADDMNGGDEPSALQRAAEISEKVDEVCAELDAIGDCKCHCFGRSELPLRSPLALRCPSAGDVVERDATDLP
jgi:hypothetical protein